MSLTILVVEDDPKSRKLLAELLAVKGHQVLEAMNGLEGVEQARSSGPDLILMDIQMPLLDGLEAMRILKADARTRHIPIWALTSYAMREDTKRICAEGCEFCLTKPFDVPGLLRHIDAIDPPPRPPLPGQSRPADAAGDALENAGQGATPR